MANPAAPQDANGVNIGFGIYDNASTAEAAWLSVFGAAAVGTATTKSGLLGVAAQPATTGGLTTFNGTTSDGGTAVSTTAVAVKASAGQLYGWYYYNPNDEVVFVAFYNTAQGSVTVGTTNPLFQLALPAGAAGHVFPPIGIAFSTAITVSSTKTAGSATANDSQIDLVLWYK